MINAIHPAPSPTSGTGAWLRATAPQITTPTFTGQVTVTPGASTGIQINSVAANTYALKLTHNSATAASGILVDGTNGAALYLANSANAGQVYLKTTGASYFLDALAVGTATIAAGARFNVATAGSANAINTQESTGNSGFGIASDSGARVRADSVGQIGLWASSDTARAVYGTSTSGNAIHGSSNTSTGVLGQSISGVALFAKHSGSLAANSGSATVFVERSLTLGAFDATGPLVLLEDSTASTGNFLRCRKQGTDRIIGTPAGKGLFLAGLGVGNSAAATTPGTVTKKVEIFDFAGASLGFAALYDAIT